MFALRLISALMLCNYHLACKSKYCKSSNFLAIFNKIDRRTRDWLVDVVERYTSWISCFYAIQQCLWLVTATLCAIQQYL